MNTANAAVPLQPFVRGQILRLSTDRQAGLILQYRYYASFAGAGAAVGCNSDVRCLSVYPLGDVHFVTLETYQQRQQALQQRIIYAKTLCKISAVHAPLQRAYLIVRQLCLWLNPKDVQAIPYKVMSQLVGVLPNHIEAGWQQYLQHYPVEDLRLASSPHLISPSCSYRQKPSPESIQVPIAVGHL
ncbi:MAG: hypothetical protein Kow00121_40190 [Elainellaceae cyanobacterium]